MSRTELIIIAFGLSMDAFAVAISKGICIPKVSWKDMMKVGLYFGIFQGIMPLIGYLIGSTFAGFITTVDHWIAFILLGILGINMVRESFSKKEPTVCDTDSDVRSLLSFKAMLPLAIATSIDALAMGISFSLLKVDIVWAVLSIGIITFIISNIGVKIGNKFGEKYKSKAEFLGGLILIVMGCKILFEHLGFWGLGN